MADMILITKVNELSTMEKASEHAKHLAEDMTKQPDIPILFGGSKIIPEATDPTTGKALSEHEATKLVAGKRVLVIDDGPTLTHGGMPYGAGYAMAKELGASEIVDPRPYAQGSLKATFEKFPHLKEVLPAMGYDDDQVRDLEATIQATPCDTVVVGTPSDITHLMDMGKSNVVVTRYELEIVKNHEFRFKEVLDSLYDRYECTHAAA